MEEKLMPKGFVYCSECGTALRIFRKAMPNYNTTLDMIKPHVCPEEPIELNLEPEPISPYMSESDKGKFAKKMDELIQHFQQM